MNSLTRRDFVKSVGALSLAGSSAVAGIAGCASVGGAAASAAPTDKVAAIAGLGAQGDSGVGVHGGHTRSAAVQQRRAQCQLGIGLQPRLVVGDPNIDPRIVRRSAAFTPADNACQDLATPAIGHHQRATAVALARIFAALLVTSANHVARQSSTAISRVGSTVAAG